MGTGAPTSARSPAAIIQGMRRSGTTNPVFLLDEVDKLAHDFHGDPGAALLEVLDPEQNRSFTDHYLELEFDLSDVLFIATANTLQGFPKRYATGWRSFGSPGIWTPRNGRSPSLPLAPASRTPRAGCGAGHAVGRRLDDIIDRYTREAGVRELDRRLSRIARKVARSRAEGNGAPKGIAAEDLRELLGLPRISPQTGTRPVSGSESPTGWRGRRRVAKSWTSRWPSFREAETYV